jgi:hypothetical protein
MKVKEVMSHDVAVASLGDAIQQAALTMGRIEAGLLPVARTIVSSV